MVRFDPLTGQFVPDHQQDQYDPSVPGLGLGLLPDPLQLANFQMGGGGGGPAYVPQPAEVDPYAYAGDPAPLTTPVQTGAPPPAADRIDAIVGAYRRPSVWTALAGAGEGALNASPFGGTLGQLGAAAIGAAKALQGSRTDEKPQTRTDYFYQSHDAEGQP